MNTSLAVKVYNSFLPRIMTGVQNELQILMYCIAAEFIRPDNGLKGRSYRAIIAMGH
jgi:hypothetical protein